MSITDSRTGTGPNGPTPAPEAEPVWQQAGRAWGHAAVDWAYRFEPYADEAIESVFAELAIGPDTTLLDLACGAGFALGRATRRGVPSAGLDASAALIEIATRRAPQAELVVGDMFALPWGEASFDRITSFNGIWGGCTEALREARRVLRPDGRIGLTFWGPGRRLALRDWFITLGSTMSSMQHEMKDLASIGAPGVVETMLADAGFGEVRRWAVDSVLECPDEEAAWATLRSPGLVVPALAIGEDELRRRVLESVASCRAADGSYRFVNELTCVVASAV